MATQVDLGKIRPVWKGDWAASTAYEQNDMVKVGVDSYICTVAHTSGGTFADTNWDLLAVGAEIPSQTGNAGLFLQSDGTNLSWQAAESTGRFLGMELLGPYSGLSGTSYANSQFDAYTGSSGTWTRPAGCNSVLVYVTGGGGGAMGNGSDYRGGAGGGGGTAIKWISNVASSVSWTVGGGGNYSNSEGTHAGDGGTSSFGSYCSGYGGEGGQGGSSGQYGASGGGASGGDMNIPGGGVGFNHASSKDNDGGMSFWTQAGGVHYPNSNPASPHGKYGSGGGSARYIGDNWAKQRGGAGVIVVYKYS